MTTTNRPRPFASIRTWRAADRHTGIGKSGRVPYTYQHVERPPAAGAEVYRVQTYIPFVAPTPLHRNVYYVPADQLDDFFESWGEHGAIVVDVRPMSIADALLELEQFRRSGSRKEPQQ
jgi:hypothetical protein